MTFQTGPGCKISFLDPGNQTCIVSLCSQFLSIPAPTIEECFVVPPSFAKMAEYLLIHHAANLTASNMQNKQLEDALLGHYFTWKTAEASNTE